MTNPGLLDFFVLEASEYVEQMDGIVAAAGQGPPSPEDLMRASRALRGSAMMARMPSLSELAGGVERVSRALRDGLVMWEPGLQGVITSAIDDLKLLLRSIRTWGPAEEQRAKARAAELARYAPVGARAATPAGPSATGLGFFASEAGDVAKAIDTFIARTGDREALGEILRRARAMRGVAAIRDLPPLAEVVEAVERAAKPLELSSAAPAAPQLALLAAASSVLRDAAQNLSLGQLPSVEGAALDRFADAARAWTSTGDADVVVPIATLFHDDGGPHIVSAAPNPPTTPAQRFRLEAVSQAEHLRRIVADARDARDAAARDRSTRELAGALRALRRGAEGFGERAVAAFVDRIADAAARRDPQALAALDEAAALLAEPSTAPNALAGRLAGLGIGPPAAVPASSAPIRPVAAAPTAPASPPAVPHRARDGRGFTPSGQPLDIALEQTLARFGALDDQPLSDPAPLPIEALLYRGNSALARARQIRDAMRSAPAPDSALLAELYDLLDLAAAE